MAYCQVFLISMPNAAAAGTSLQPTYWSSFTWWAYTDFKVWEQGQVLVEGYNTSGPHRRDCSVLQQGLHG